MDLKQLSYLVVFAAAAVLIENAEGRPNKANAVPKSVSFGQFANETANTLNSTLNNNITSKPTKQRVRTTHIMFARPYDFDNETVICTRPSVDDFPSIFTNEQRKRGAVILAFLLGIYCFTILAIICDNYFLPCMERICETLNLSKDVGAATFMSVATSAPELFVNIIGTFVTNSDIGIGTVVGSSMFNSLGVAALGGLAAASPVQLDWWPVTRDVTIYIFAISILVAMTWDGMIYWYEGLVLFIAYFVYFTIMFMNPKISKFAKKLAEKYCGRRKKEKNNNTTTNNNNNKNGMDNVKIAIISEKCVINSDEPLKKYTEPKEEKSKEADSDKEEKNSLWNFPSGSWYQKAFFIYVWPIKLILRLTIPDPMKYKKIFPVTFIMCIIWIGINSYVVSWMISIIGHVFHIPDAVLGLTFLAAGGCLPEAISIVIMARKGEGSMGVSNSLGANTMNILLSLGMPWFLKTVINGADNNSFIQIESGSIEFTILALIIVALTLYLTLYVNKFRLSKKLGGILILIYSVCIVLAILSEVVFFKSNKECT